MVLNEFKLDGKVTIISACGRTLLKELTLSLAQAGAKVVLTAKDSEDLMQIVLTVQREGWEVVAIPTELTCAKEVQSMVDQVIQRFGRIDILINNLNLEYWKPFLDMSEKEWHQVIDANLTSTFLCSKAVGRYMTERKAGRIVNILSGLSERGLSNGAVYCASMGGMLQLTRALALEWASQNVRVNAIGVGWMEEPLIGEKKDVVGGYIPMGRRARPKDVTPLVLFLASEASSFLNGNIYLVDGGLMSRS